MTYIFTILVQWRAQLSHIGVTGFLQLVPGGSFSSWDLEFIFPLCPVPVGLGSKSLSLAQRQILADGFPLSCGTQGSSNTLVQMSAFGFYKHNYFHLPFPYTLVFYPITKPKPLSSLIHRIWPKANFKRQSIKYKLIAVIDMLLINDGATLVFN